MADHSFLSEVKSRCGIAHDVTVYDSEINGLLSDWECDMNISGVSADLIAEEKYHDAMVAAATLYVRMYLGGDTADVYKYRMLYREKIFRLSMEVYEA